MAPAGYDPLPLGGSSGRARSNSRTQLGGLRRLAVSAGTASLRRTAFIGLVSFFALIFALSRLSTHDAPVAVVTEPQEEIKVEPPPPPPVYFPAPPEPCNAPTVYNFTNQLFESPAAALPLDASLSARLAAWQAAPIANSSVWEQFNALVCRVSPEDYRQRERAVWRDLKEETVVELRANLSRALLEAEERGDLEVPKEQRGTKGLVFTAGNADTFSRVIVSLRMLRHYGCELPAEVFYFTEAEQPSDEEREDLDKLGATAREARGISKEADPDRSKSFHIKGAALVQSSFEEVLLLDSDSIPAADVTPLFSAPGYLQAGALFWPDFWREDAANGIWSILGLQCRDEWTQEAGQVLINKSLHMDALYLVQEQLKDWRYWFDFSDGDKDLFRYAFLALRKPMRWAVPGRHLASASIAEDHFIRQHQGFCGHTMMQYDHEGEPLFVHANLLKRILGQFGVGNTWGRTLQLALDAYPPPETAPETKEEEAERLRKEHQGDEYEWRAESSEWRQVKGEGRIKAPAPKEGESTRKTVNQLIDALVGAPPPPPAEKGARDRRQLIDPLQAIKSFPTLADHLANPNHPSGKALLDAPFHVRQRAVREPALAASFLQGHRGSSYVLCVDLNVEQPPQPAFAVSVGKKEKDWCGLEEWAEEVGSAKLETVLWRDHPRLSGFEKLFYQMGGRANGMGFKK